MKTIEVDEALYRYIASHTLHIGESASEILRRMLNLPPAGGDDVRMESGEVLPVASATSPVDREDAFRQRLADCLAGEQKKAVDRFLLILSSLYGLDKPGFAEATESLMGRTRVYFSLSEATLLKNGRHTKPKSIPDTPYWVITNTNTERKRSMVEHIMTEMRFPETLTGEVCLMI